jgi:hypothetical protein
LILIFERSSPTSTGLYQSFLNSTSEDHPKINDIRWDPRHSEQIDSLFPDNPLLTLKEPRLEANLRIFCCTARQQSYHLGVGVVDDRQTHGGFFSLNEVFSQSSPSTAKLNIDVSASNLNNTDVSV